MKGSPVLLTTVVVWTVRGQWSGDHPNPRSGGGAVCREVPRRGDHAAYVPHCVGQAIGPPARGAGRPMALSGCTHGERSLVTYFSERLARSMVPNAVLFTPVTLSDQPKVAVEYHSGMAGMSLARRASACW